MLGVFSYVFKVAADPLRYQPNTTPVMVMSQPAQNTQAQALANAIRRAVIDYKLQVAAAVRQSALVGSQINSTEKELLRTRKMLIAAREGDELVEARQIINDFRVTLFCANLKGLCLNDTCRMYGCVERERSRDGNPETSWP
jgi:hypothetical protein